MQLDVFTPVIDQRTLSFIKSSIKDLNRKLQNQDHIMNDLNFTMILGLGCLREMSPKTQNRANCSHALSNGIREMAANVSKS